MVVGRRINVVDTGALDSRYMTLLLALVSFWDDRGGLPVTLRCVISWSL